MDTIGRILLAVAGISVIVLLIGFFICGGYMMLLLLINFVCDILRIPRPRRLNDIVLNILDKQI